MNHGYNRYCALLRRINDVVRKPSQRATAGSFRNRRPRIRELKDERDGVFQFFDKLETESSLFVLVIIRGCFDFPFSNYRELELHEYLRLRRASTSSPGKVSSSPRSIASRRDSVSAAHLASLSLSGTSPRLSRIRSTSSARS